MLNAVQLDQMVRERFATATATYLRRNMEAVDGWRIAFDRAAKKKKWSDNGRWSDNSQCVCSTPPPTPLAFKRGQDDREGIAEVLTEYPALLAGIVRE